MFMKCEPVSFTLTAALLALGCDEGVATLQEALPNCEILVQRTTPE